MPIVDGSDFQPAGRYRSGHYNTLIPHLLGTKPSVDYERIRIDTPDDDFLDLDYIRKDNGRLAILCHGLEGDSNSGYILLFANYLARQGWDIAAMNYRGCSGTPNRQLRMYNSGTTDDLDTTIRHSIKDYDEVALIGFSLGGNLVLKYAGEGVFDLSPKIKSIVAISTPLHLEDASKRLLDWDNLLYQWRFLLSLTAKIRAKKKQFPHDIDMSKLLKCTNLYKFDDYFTAPIYGYEDAADYYAQNMSLQWLDRIRVPSLIINASDDPFLGPLCYPTSLVRDLDNVHLCVPKYGGHVGFAYDRNDHSWVVKKAQSFIRQYSSVALNS